MEAKLRKLDNFRRHAFTDMREPLSVGDLRVIPSFIGALRHLLVQGVELLVEFRSEVFHALLTMPVSCPFHKTCGRASGLWGQAGSAVGHSDQHLREACTASSGGKQLAQ